MDTQNQAWAADKSKFGYRMLEKMGWKEGKGLGAKEDGIKAHIRIKRKRCNGGLGTQGKTEAMWRVPGEVATGFNDVLSRIATKSNDTDDNERVGSDPCSNSTEDVLTAAPNGKISYFGRKSRQKNVRQYSEAQLREIFGGAAIMETVESPGLPLKSASVSETAEGRIKKKKRSRKDKMSKSEKKSKTSVKPDIPVQ